MWAGVQIYVNPKLTNNHFLRTWSRSWQKTSVRSQRGLRTRHDHDLHLDDCEQAIIIIIIVDQVGWYPADYNYHYHHHHHYHYHYHHHLTSLSSTRLEDIRLMESRKSARLLNTDTDFSRLADFNIVEQVLKDRIIIGIQEGLLIAHLSLSSKHFHFQRKLLKEVPSRRRLHSMSDFHDRWKILC